MENIIEIYWYDLSKEKQRELLDAGFDNENIVDGIVPLIQVFMDSEE